VRFRGLIGLSKPQQVALKNYEKQLREGSTQALNRVLRDRRQDAGTLKAIKQGIPLTEEEIAKRVTRYEQRLLKYRAETIARTEALRMTNMANQHIYDNAIEEGRITPNAYKRYWVAANDTRTRDAHVALPSMNKEGRAIDEPFHSPLGMIMYPHDPMASAANTINCRCTLVYSLQMDAFQ
jgi:hypothetical protein